MRWRALSGWRRTNRQAAACAADLFADDHNGIFLTDGALLDTLARDKLVPLAEQVRAEGWAQVDAAPRATASDLYNSSGCLLPRTQTRPSGIALPTQNQRASCRSNWTTITITWPAGQAQALHDALDALGNELEAMEAPTGGCRLPWWRWPVPCRSIPWAGSWCTVACCERNKSRPCRNRRGRKRTGRAATRIPAPTSLPSQGLSEKLAKRLSAHRTAALQAEVARHPHVALVALLHRLALRVIVESYGAGDSAVNISATPRDGLGLHAPDMADAPAAVGMCKVREAWAHRLPNDPDSLFAELLAFPQQGLLSLLAVCVACTVSALASQEEEVRHCAGAGREPRHARLEVDPDRGRLLRACLESQDAGSGAGVCAGSGGRLEQAQEGRDCEPRPNGWLWGPGGCR